MEATDETVGLGRVPENIHIMGLDLQRGAN